MDPLTAAAASGLRSRMQSLDMLANNLANASTGGYKLDREFYSTYIAPEVADESGNAGAMPVVEKPWTDFSQGTLQTTGHQLDVALTGPGFFSVNGPSGPLYTRNGNFQLSSNGTLTTAEGYPVRLVGNQTLQVQSQAPLDIDSSGNIQQNGQLLGTLELASFSNSDISKTGGAYFKAGATAKVAPATAATVHQSALENSNVQVPEAAVRLVTLMRHYESLQKAINIATRMNDESVTEVARITS